MEAMKYATDEKFVMVTLPELSSITHKDLGFFLT
jgi:hypothetical protein